MLATFPGPRREAEPLVAAVPPPPPTSPPAAARVEEVVSLADLPPPPPTPPPAGARVEEVVSLADGVSPPLLTTDTWGDAPIPRAEEAAFSVAVLPIRLVLPGRRSSTADSLAAAPGLPSGLCLGC